MKDVEDKESEQDRLIAVIIKELDDLKEIRNDAFRQVKFCKILHVFHLLILFILFS